MVKVIFNIPEEMMPIKVDVTSNATNSSVSVPVVSSSSYTDSFYNKGHKVPEGLYLVKLVDVKCHSKECYKLKVEITRGAETEVITGYSNRDQYGYYDLADCFSNGVLHSRTSKYVGGLGYITLSHSGWIALLSRSFDTITFPDFKACNRPGVNIQDDFDEYSKRFE